MKKYQSVRHALSTRRARALAALGMLLCFGAAGTFAYWSDTAALNSGAISSGTMDLQLTTPSGTGAVGTGVNHTDTAIAATGLLPGESHAFNITVKNVGAAGFTYTATATRGATPAWTYVGTPIRVQFFTGTASVDTTSPIQETCSGSSVGTMQALDATNKAVITTRTLSANTNDALCMVVSMDPTAGNDNQGKTGAVKVDFTANQVTS